MNTVPLRDFNSKEMDLFFSICSQMRDKELSTITFTFEQLKDLSDYKFTAYDRFINDIENIYNKLIKLNIRIETEEKIVRFVLFTKYEIDKTKTNISISVNEEFKYILNEITGNFTKFELQEFVSLRSSYSKTLYRLLKQYRKTGYLILGIDDFRENLCVPDSYRMTDIDRQIINVCQKELKPYIKSLEINKLAKGKGRKVTHIEFIFMAEDDFKENDKKTFRDKDGFYYEKDFLDMTEDEIQKEYPNAPQPQAEKYYKNW